MSKRAVCLCIVRCLLSEDVRTCARWVIRETSVCLCIIRLMNNHIKSRKEQHPKKEETATTRTLWLL